MINVWLCAHYKFLYYYYYYCCCCGVVAVSLQSDTGSFRRVTRSQTMQKTRTKSEQRITYSVAKPEAQAATGLQRLSFFFLGELSSRLCTTPGNTRNLLEFCCCSWKKIYNSVLYFAVCLLLVLYLRRVMTKHPTLI